MRLERTMPQAARVKGVEYLVYNDNFGLDQPTRATWWAGLVRMRVAD
jgi:hypothetical protein